MSEKQEQNDAPDGALKAWLDGGAEPDDLPAAYDAADGETRQWLFDTLISMRGQIGDLAETIMDLGLRGTENDGACAVADARLRELVADKGALSSALEKARAQLARSKVQVKSLQAEVPAKARKWKVDGERPGVAELLAAIDDADTVELAFVGERGMELPGIAPASISGGAAAFRASGERLLLRVPSLPVNSPVPVQLHGYVMLTDGKLLAYARRSDALPLAPSTHYELKDDVVF